jgi:phenylpropionate dioxygenase-like ring-hydroxylating dioxygenase large terminal subunit
MHTARPGERVDNAPLTSQTDFSGYRMRVSTDRYYSQEYLARERERLWMRVWQIVGRADEVPQAGDYMEYRLFDQSYLVVRGKDGVVRGFVNACRHRGNQICTGKGHATRFTCAYHKWTYGLDGKLMTVANPYFGGTVENFVGPKEELGLLPVSVEVFAGFVFLNPDPQAKPLADFLGVAKDMLAAYQIDDMVPVTLNTRETINCNWKVVMDAFQEGYHVQAVHPELIAIADLTHERFTKLGHHGASTVPLAVPGANSRPEDQVELIRSVPKPNFPAVAEVMPRFEELVAAYRQSDGSLNFPAGVTARTFLQQATRESWVTKGLDVSSLTDNQMSDYQYWSLFPNTFLQLGPGDVTFIQSRPHPSGNPERCIWRVTQYKWLPPEEREKQRLPLTEIAEGEHVPYFLALEQDFSQMEAQQHGLRNNALKYMVLTKQEPRLANLHTVLDGWLEGDVA